MLVVAKQQWYSHGWAKKLYCGSQHYFSLLQYYDTPVCMYSGVGAFIGKHNFELTTFEEACLCDVCGKLLCGCYFQGYYCQGGCGYYSLCRVLTVSLFSQHARRQHTMIA